MMKKVLIVGAILGFAATATAIAAINTGAGTLSENENVTVLEKNQAWPVFGEIEVDECQIEDCSEE